MTPSTVFMIIYSIIFIMWIIRAVFTFRGQFYGFQKHKDNLSQRLFKKFCSIKAAGDVVFGVGWFFLGMSQALTGSPDRVIPFLIALMSFIICLFLNGLANYRCYKKWILFK